TAAVTYDGRNLWGTSGVSDYVVLKTTDSEFWGFLQDRYTTLQPTNDRVMDTSVTSQWWPTATDVDWSKSYDQAVTTMSSVFAGHHSLALQHTMFEMGAAMIAKQPKISEPRFAR